MVKWTWRSSQVLGLAVGEREILCAQVERDGSGATIRKLAKFDLPQREALQEPQAAGEALRALLMQHGFTATRAVVGLPARLLVAHDREVPPVNLEQAAAMLRLQAERLVAGDPTDIVFDFAGAPDPSAASRVLLVGTLRQHLERIATMLAAARLTPVAITATALVAADLLAEGNSRTLVMLAGHVAEVVTLHRGRPQALRHLSRATGAGDASFARFASDLRRVVALSPSGDGDRTAADQLVAWDDAGLSDPQVAELSEQAGLQPYGKPALDALGATVAPAALNGNVGGTFSQALLPAIALALEGVRRGRWPVNFLRSRLSPPRVRRVTRRTVLAAAAVAAVILGMGGLYLTVAQREAQAVLLTEQLRTMAPDIKAAQAAVQRMTLGRGYYRTRPPVLDCLRAIALTIQDDDPLWITSFTFRDANKGQLQGKSSDQSAVLALLDRLRGDAHFADVQLLDLREAGGRTRETDFSITFAYVAREVAP